MARIARTRKGENLDDLTARLFEAADAKSGMKAAADGLAAANRHLRLRGRGRNKVLEAGTFVAVPDAEGAEHTRASVPLSDAAAGILLERTRQGLEQLGPQLDTSRREAERELERTLELADSKALRAAAKRDEVLAKRLDGIREHGKRRLEDVARADAHQRSAVERAGKTISDLLERVARGS